MSHEYSVASVKRKLQDLGITTATPGLVGEERFIALKKRLILHESKFLVNSAINDALIDKESLDEISIADLRDRLSSLGEVRSTVLSSKRN
jgi:hypothetical protein